MFLLIFFKEIGFSLLKFWINIFPKRAQDYSHFVFAVYNLHCFLY